MYRLQNPCPLHRRQRSKQRVCGQSLRAGSFPRRLASADQRTPRWRQSAASTPKIKTCRNNRRSCPVEIKVGCTYLFLACASSHSVGGTPMRLLLAGLLLNSLLLSPTPASDGSPAAIPDSPKGFD